VRDAETENALVAVDHVLTAYDIKRNFSSNLVPAAGGPPTRHVLQGIAESLQRAFKLQKLDSMNRKRIAVAISIVSTTLWRVGGYNRSSR
jgi:hypothetical protein